MGVVRYTSLAEDDLYEIAIFTIKKWSLEQAGRYIAGLEEFCDFLSGQQGIGRECNQIAAGLRRIEHESHVIFFYLAADGITVSRVLHKSRNLSEEEFDEFG